ncbi:MAG: outer membrane receptor protein involved in Fe transport [Candidatus Krumholzibacteriia bacterium]|jgi:outer membrane receptor protein involved in Fe transport
MLRFDRIQWLVPRVLLLVLLTFMVTAISESVAPSVAIAQTPATISGTVKDKESGESLDYANILIVGSTRGTMTLGSGRFYFNGLGPGTYTVKVLYLGYAPVEQTVTVAAGENKTLLFDLETVIVEQLQAFDVEGDEYMVEVKNAKDEHKFGSETFEKFAIDSVEDAISKQAGVVSRAGEIFVRGGRSGELAMQIDGVDVGNPLGNGSLQVSTLAVESTSVITGGLDAKYGNALSGVVNITTKEGGQKFGGGVRFLTDDFGRQDKTFTNYDRFEYGFGGPTPVKGLTYYLAGDMSFTDTENTSVAHRPEYKVKLGDTTLFKYRGRQSNNAKGSIKLGYTLSENKKVTAEYSYSVSANQFYAPNWNTKGFAQRVLHMPEVVPLPNSPAWFATGRTIAVYYGPWYEEMLFTARTVMVVDSRNASQRREALPVIEVRGAADNRLYTVVAQAMFDGAQYPYGAFSTVEEDSSYAAFNAADNFVQSKNIGQVGKVVWRHNLTESTFYTVRIGLVAFDTRRDVNGKDPYEYNHGPIGSPGLFFGQRNIYSGQNDYYSDPLNAYFVTNSDLATYTEEYSRTYSIGTELVSARWEGHLAEIGMGVRYNDLERFGLAGPAIMRQSRFTGEWSQGGNRNIFHTYNPEAYLYLQDRWEYEGMVVSYGLRYDMFSPGSAAAIELANENVDTNVVKYKTAMQPRLGFAFPITERDGFHFHYGRFVQFPSREFLFASQDPVGNGGILGNPNLQPETTVQYSAGIKHQFTDYIAGTFSLYSKDTYDLIASNQVTDEAAGQTLARYINKAYANGRGIEFSLDKRYNRNYSFNFSYTYSFADGVASDPAFGASPDGFEFLPNQELPLDWDQRHTLNLLLLFSKPGSWSSSFSFSYGSGFPWTPVDRFAKRQDPLLENSETLPATYSLDIQLERNINVYGKRLSLQLQGLNILNQDVVINPGGGGLNPGPINGASYGGLPYLTETGKYGAALLQDADGDGEDEFIPFNDPRTFGQHRLFRFGIGYYF